MAIDDSWKTRGYRSLNRIVSVTCVDRVEKAKLECIGNVHKRMGSRLRKLKRDKGQKLNDGKVVNY